MDQTRHHGSDPMLKAGDPILSDLFKADPTLPKVLRSYQKHSDYSPFISADDLLNLESAGKSVLLKDDEEEDATKSTLQAVLVFFYVLTGVLQPILIEVLTYNGACEKSTFLFLLPTYVGMTLSIVANFDAWNQGKIRWMRISILLLIDLGSGILCFTGLVNAGSAIFTVVYSSVTVYTALFSWLFFGRQLHYMLWSGVCLVMLGLLSSTFGSNMFSGADNEDVGLGILMIMVGSMFHSLYYIVSESVLKDDNPIAPEFLGTFQGIFGTTVFGLWQLLYTIPRWETLISDEIAAHKGDMTEILCTYIGLVIVNFIHGICLFYMLKMVGSTTTGVLKGVISVAVFIISHFAFCSLQQSQCFSVAKGIRVILIHHITQSPINELHLTLIRTIYDHHHSNPITIPTVPHESISFITIMIPILIHTVPLQGFHWLWWFSVCCAIPATNSRKKASLKNCDPNDVICCRAPGGPPPTALHILTLSTKPNL